MADIGIINIGMGNITSVLNALQFIGSDGEFVDTPKAVGRCSKIILPGVGSFGEAITRLEEGGIADALRDHVSRGAPLLGICLGMQLLYSSSMEYGFHHGLGFIDGAVESLEGVADGLSVPHVGWSFVERRGAGMLLDGIPDDKLCFYFVHSYYCSARDRGLVTGAIEYGCEVDVAVEKENVFGCQFHPEKSQRYGLDILSNFVRF